MNIRTLCLGILSMREASGYEIKKELEDGKFSHFVEASFGSIYPALTQMNAEGLLSVRAEEQSGRPDKKVYAITEAGKAALAKNLSVIPARDKFKSEFLFEMLFQEILTPDHVDLAIDKQHADLTEDLARIAEKRVLKGGCDQIGEGPRFVMGYAESILRAAVEFLEAQCPRLKKSKIKAAE
ncbi:PadR family transcriptional regulator [Aestuariivirga litoralis]|uniref:PadR family transcriptional regulator n=1 Tax=Aestuariivirga litoralis TaxID=2650924 RepID=UPI0018C5E887|nr:PadR family transcriptional regulator [Aestuariivirga litoralis]MBG1231941.1 PadR family transcriptional regulator [Aestuariivirga litoralis]